MWGSEKSTGRREMAFAQGTVSGMTRKSGAHRKGEKLSRNMAMFLGINLTAEIMIAGAMVFNFDFKGADVIALIFAFMVLYSGVVAMLTDK